VDAAAWDVVRDLAGSPECLQSRRDRKKATSGSGSKCYSLISKHIGFDCVSFRGAKDEFLLTAIAQNHLRELAKLDHP
jgi:hypothetical protein